ncbi:MAG TPA: 16S rRNA (uracil(1498)-N(3))-methyltransferase [Candidatus Cloacimonetes bacterium]|nr:16S rRNA (uracil(1498)-N(3))-methyltransferase [Candidatus Cloacimonadota bacterium]HEX37835.1 16S rRNA (uracil(1498)-N(3))-methyltransferase [Candidatus Cloacimonadota bacterium]
MPLFYSPDLKDISTRINITGSEYHHLKTSLRKHEGDQISITNGNGILAKGRINKILPNHISVQIDTTTSIEKSKPYISIAFSLLKKNNELIVEKCTELGIYEFFPFISERTVKKSISLNQLDRLRKVAISAMKQCDSVYLPEIHNPLQISELLKQIHNNYNMILAWEEEQNTPLHTILKKAKKDICLIVGPEGGFEENEVTLAKEYGSQIVSLGNHILRAETAAITACAQAIFYQLKQNPEYY